MTCPGKPAAPLGREHAEVGPGVLTLGQTAPQAERGGDADVEESVERQEDGDGAADLILTVKPEARAGHLDDLITVFDSENGLEAARVEAKFRGRCQL